jgi:pyridoxal phosphate enzyme (YggS family)
MSDLVRSIHERYLYTLERIASAARSAGREPESVKLVVVTKAQPMEVVRAAVEAGVKVLGENYPEEGSIKIQSVGATSGVEWHMIGHVQSRKAQLVARHFDWMHSVDSLKLANRMERFCREDGRTLPVLLEFNVGEEETKSGWSASDESRWPDFLYEISGILELPHLEVRGLMTMPPLGESAESTRPFFQRLRRLQDFLNGHYPAAYFKELSMGTSLDYEVAVQEGATMLRVGTAIVGHRSN